MWIYVQCSYKAHSILFCLCLGRSFFTPTLLNAWKSLIIFWIVIWFCHFFKKKKKILCFGKRKGKCVMQNIQYCCWCSHLYVEFFYTAVKVFVGITIIPILWILILFCCIFTRSLNIVGSIFKTVSAILCILIYVRVCASVWCLFVYIQWKES